MIGIHGSFGKFLSTNKSRATRLGVLLAVSDPSRDDRRSSVGRSRSPPVCSAALLTRSTPCFVGTNPGGIEFLYDGCWGPASTGRHVQRALRPAIPNTISARFAFRNRLLGVSSLTLVFFKIPFVGPNPETHCTTWTVVSKHAPPVCPILMAGARGAFQRVVFDSTGSLITIRTWCTPLFVISGRS